MTVVEAVTPDVVATANQDAQAKPDALTKAETAVTSAEQSQADTAQKVADQTTVVNNAEAEAQRLQELKDKADAITRNGSTPVEVFDDNGNLINVVDGSANKGVAPTVAQTTFKPKADSKGSYSRVERSQQLPNTGSQDSLLGLFGVGILAGLGLGYTEKRRKNKNECMK